MNRRTLARQLYASDSESQEELNCAIDEAHELVWRQRNGRRKAAWVVVDLDSHVRPVYGGAKKIGPDFSYKGASPITRW